MNKIVLLAALMIAFLFLYGCRDEKPETGKITFKFRELVDSAPLVTDTMKYINEAGNHYMITEVQYFISKLKVYLTDGQSFEVTQDQGIHYSDSDLPETHTWAIAVDVPAGIVDSITFIVGLDSATNKTGLFVNPPESNMYWPDELGGGYHYMKLNGKYLASDNEVKMFNFHLGIGQTYDTTGNVTGFVQNYFFVSASVPVYSSYAAIIKSGQINNVDIAMNIDSWFRTPHTWDFNVMGGMMMQDEQAMKMACENGFDVFTLVPDE